MLRSLASMLRSLHAIFFPFLSELVILCKRVQHGTMFGLEFRKGIRRGAKANKNLRSTSRKARVNMTMNSLHGRLKN
jgi:hypothetical protein